MSLTYAFLHEVYENWPEGRPIQSASYESDTPPNYEDNVEDDSLKYISENIKPYDKLRIINSELEIDSRIFKTFTRLISRDDRFKILEKLKEKKDSKNVKTILEILCKFTYKNDLNFVSKCYEVIDSSIVKQNLPYRCCNEVFKE